MSPQNVSSRPPFSNMENDFHLSNGNPIVILNFGFIYLLNVSHIYTLLFFKT